jgi:hypothetical protein
MTKPHCKSTFKLSHWLSISLLISLITGCGAAVQFANGIGGTGITMGAITGFGSIYVNGVKFDTDNAQFSRDGVDAKLQSDFSAGEVVKIIGTVDKAAGTGVATDVIFSDLVEGPITALIDANTIEVLGQIILTDELTVLHGVKTLSELTLDNMLEISGFTNAEGNILASSIKLLQDSFSIGSILDVEGTISEIDPITKTFKLNGNLIIDYGSSLFEGLSEADLVDNLYVALSSEQNIQNNTVIAHTLYAIDTSLEIDVIYEIEGLITRFVSPTEFDIDGIPVSTNAKTVYKNGSATQLGLNQFAIIKGTSNANGVLIAEQINLFDSSSEVWAEGYIEAIDNDTQQIRLLGESITADFFTLFTDETQEEFVDLNFSQLSLGDFISLTAYRNNQGQTIASRISKVKQEFSALYLSAKLESVQAELGIITLFGQTISTDSLTLYFDTEANIISQTQFFNTLSNNPDHLVDVTGTIIGEKMILAETMGLLKNQ